MGTVARLHKINPLYQTEALPCCLILHGDRLTHHFMHQKTAKKVMRSVKWLPPLSISYTTALRCIWFLGARCPIVSSPAHFRPPFCNGPKGGLAHLLDILIPPLGRLPKFWQAPPCLAIRNLAASFAHLRESYLGILSNEIKLYPILPLSQF